MTNEQINRAIAEACGWKPRRQTKLTRTGHFKVSYENPPEYCSDLNAMHEAEKHIFQEIWYVYINQLAKVTSAEESTDPSFLCAPARQRAEAFLRTVGKWKEVQP